jgi:hypothetical protein
MGARLVLPLPLGVSSIRLLLRKKPLGLTPFPLCEKLFVHHLIGKVCEPSQFPRDFSPGKNKPILHGFVPYYAIRFYFHAYPD